MSGPMLKAELEHINGLAANILRTTLELEVALGAIGAAWDVQAAALKDEVADTRIDDLVTYRDACELLKRLRGYARDVRDAIDGPRNATNSAHRMLASTAERYLRVVRTGEDTLRKRIEAYGAFAERIRGDVTAAAEREAAQKAAAGADDIGLAPAIPRYPKDLNTPGVRLAHHWDCEVLDVRELCRAVADGQVGVDAVVVNETELQRMATALRNNMKVPGVRVVARSTAVVTEEASAP